MEILKSVSEKCDVKGLSFILIGGHALNYYGFDRLTEFVELLIAENNRNEWKEIMEELGYKLYHDHHSFLQFSPKEVAQWPVDFMIVDQATFDGVWNEGDTIRIAGMSIKIPGVEHLLAMKLHAIKQNQSFRELKDLDDVIELTDKANVDIEGDDFKEAKHFLRGDGPVL